MEGLIYIYCSQDIQPCFRFPFFPLIFKIRFLLSNKPEFKYSCSGRSPNNDIYVTAMSIKFLRENMLCPCLCLFFPNTFVIIDAGGRSQFRTKPRYFFETLPWSLLPNNQIVLMCFCSHLFQRQPHVYILQCVDGKLKRAD